MELDNIERLLRKYDNAETSLAEEEQLRVFFNQPDVPAHLEAYKLFFQYVSHSKKEHFKQELNMQPRRSKRFQWIAVAAVAVLVLAAYIQVDRMNQKATLADLNQEELMAYHQTMEVIHLVSTKFNKGTNKLQAIELVSNKLNEGAENLIHLKDFSTTATTTTTTTTNKRNKNK